MTNAPQSYNIHVKKKKKGVVINQAPDFQSSDLRQSPGCQKKSADT